MLFIWMEKNHGGYLPVLQTMTWRMGMQPKSSLDFLTAVSVVQAERGQEYDLDDDQKERSFAATARAFNAITRKDLTPAEVCLLLALLKHVRQWTNPERLHQDSLLDGLSYTSLMCEELAKQFPEQ